MVILGMMAMYGNEGGGNTINDISGYDNSCDYNGNYILQVRQPEKWQYTN